jgi:hypothetical protein
LFLVRHEYNWNTVRWMLSNYVINHSTNQM